MKHSWSTAASRADQLAADHEASGEIMRFYARLVGAQSEIDRRLRSGRTLSGSLTRDLPAIRPLMIRFLETIAATASQKLALEARTLLATSPAGHDAVLLQYWSAPTDDQFFAKAFLQPYVCLLAEIGAKPQGRNLPRTFTCCPFCAGRPQLTVLQAGTGGDPAPGRSLQCATCLSTWPFRRVVCAQCGEERENKVAYFRSSDHDHVRIEACDTCRSYLKGIDLSRLGLAIPIVDEVAVAVLDVWAREHGYSKIELNLVGL